MKRSFWVLALVALAAVPALAVEPASPREEPPPTPAVSPAPAATPATEAKTVPPAGLRGPWDLYGSFWFPGIYESEWSSFLIPTGPMSFWDAYTWGFVRFRYWFDAMRFGGSWPPNFSPLGWGWDGWYGGWYGWLPDGVPAGGGMGGGLGFAPILHPFQVAPVRPAEVIAPRPIGRAGRPSKGWFGGAIRPARPDERMSNDSDDWSRGGLSGGGAVSKPGSRGGGGPTGTTRPASPPVTSRPPIRRR